MEWYDVRGFDASVSECQRYRVIWTSNGYKPQYLRRTESPQGMRFESWRDLSSPTPTKRAAVVACESHKEGCQ